MKKIYLFIICLAMFALKTNAQCDVYFNTDIEGATVYFNASHTDTLASGSYFWDFGDQQTSTLKNPIHTYTSSGSFYVNLYFTSTDSLCTPYYTYPVEINLTPTYYIGGMIYADSSPLDSATVTLYKKDSLLYYTYLDTVVNGSEFIINDLPQGIYLFKASPVVSTAQFSQFLPTYFGNTTTWTNAQEVNLDSWMEVNLVPFFVTDTSWNTGNDIIDGTIFQDTTGFGRAGSNPVRNTTVNMRNSSDDLLITELTDEDGKFSIKNVAAGSYTISVDYPGYTMQPYLVTADGDSTTTTTINFDLNQDGSIVTSILYTQNKINIGNVSVFPNPASESVVISTASFNLQPVQIKITSFSGKVIYNEQLIIQNEEVKLNTSVWPNGLYFITVISDDSSTTKKLIIKQ